VSVGPGATGRHTVNSPAQLLLPIGTALSIAVPGSGAYYFTTTGVIYTPASNVGVQFLFSQNTSTGGILTAVYPGTTVTLYKDM